MFETELEMEKREGSSFGPIIVIGLLFALFLGGIGIVVYQSRQSLKPEEASAIIEKTLTKSGPVTSAFSTGNLGPDALDPQYKLLEKAGLIKIDKIKDKAKGKSKIVNSQVDLTPAGKDFLALFPDVKGTPGKDNTTVYALPLASRKVTSVTNVTKITPYKIQVQYIWAWTTTKAGDMFDVAGPLMQSLPTSDRNTLIDKHGANFYHAAPTPSTILLTKDEGQWGLPPSK